MATEPKTTSDAPRPASIFDRALPAWAAGVIAAAATMALSLPLRSPDDLIGNAASVAILSVATAAVLGIVWAKLDGSTGRSRLLRFAAINLALLVGTVITAMVIEPVADIANATSFVAPLAAAMLTLTTLGTPLIRSVAPISGLRFAVPILAILTITAGVVLTLNDVGFTEPPSLSLPPPP